MLQVLRTKLIIHDGWRSHPSHKKSTQEGRLSLFFIPPTHNQIPASRPGWPCPALTLGSWALGAWGPPSNLRLRRRTLAARSPHVPLSARRERRLAGALMLGGTMPSHSSASPSHSWQAQVVPTGQQKSHSLSFPGYTGSGQ